MTETITREDVLRAVEDALLEANDVETPFETFADAALQAIEDMGLVLMPRVASGVVEETLFEKDRAAPHFYDLAVEAFQSQLRKEKSDG